VTGKPWVWAFCDALAKDVLPSAPDLASQPTLSRLENWPDLRALLRMGKALINLYCASYARVPKRIVLDFDDTFDAVHGGQQLRLFNAHYDEYGFQPIVVFDGDGRFVTAMLRRQAEDALRGRLLRTRLRGKSHQILEDPSRRRSNLMQQGDRQPVPPVPACRGLLAALGLARRHAKAFGLEGRAVRYVAPSTG
jgi:hypothetical protein